MRLVAVLCSMVAAQLVLLEVVIAQSTREVNEEAPYTVVKVAEGYEERDYPRSTWVCYDTDLQEPTIDPNAYWPLFGYFSGLNSDNVSIPMTAPVTAKLVGPDGGPWRGSTCFYLPKIHQENPPDPVNKSVYVNVILSRTVFARQIGGNLTATDWKNLADELWTILQSTEPLADSSPYYFASYDSPSQATDRRNEAWFRKVDL